MFFFIKKKNQKKNPPYSSQHPDGYLILQHPNNQRLAAKAAHASIALTLGHHEAAVLSHYTENKRHRDLFSARGGTMVLSVKVLRSSPVGD
jgi:hypothetical protein